MLSVQKLAAEVPEQSHLWEGVEPFNTNAKRSDCIMQFVSVEEQETPRQRRGAGGAGAAGPCGRQGLAA
jgi:hypothetical protein